MHLVLKTSRALVSGWVGYLVDRVHTTLVPLSQIQLESKLQPLASQKLAWGNH
jgi:hypothetical protein